MASYSLRIKKSAIKELEAISTKADRRRIVQRIESLAEDPRQPGAQKLSGHNHYRIRQGRYRILYTVSDRELVVYVVRIADRKDAYRNLQ
ncbi:MAG: type II toxin-antitoxin system RelE family toxin [Woeseiaceae bacterium]